MPIYAYRCDACGFTKDVLQKLSDPPLTDCPSCGKAAFGKTLTAPAFQLKGTGWYVTDFRDGKQGKKGESGDGKSAGEGAGEGKAAEGKAEGGKSEGGGKPAEGAAAPAATPAPAPAPAPSPGSGSDSKAA